MLLLILKNPVVRFLIGLALNLTFIAGVGLYFHHKGYESGAKSVQARWNAATVKQDLIVAQANAKTIAIQQHDAQVSKDISTRYESQLAKLRKDNAQKTSRAYGITCHDRVRVGNTPSSAGAMPKISNGASRPDAVPADPLVTRLPEDCTVTTQQLVDLQAWIEAVK